jgi:hypothetical protein
MNEIGGYFELELEKRGEYHTTALSLNTGRNCLEYILLARNYSKVYLPYYICNQILEPLSKLKIDFEFYHIDENLNPTFDGVLMSSEAILVVNYFGLKQNTIKEIAKKYTNLIIDNTQAFFSEPLKGFDTFYSARKFFGVPDGAYLYTDSCNDAPLQEDISYSRMIHLLKRKDRSAEIGYTDFVKNEDNLRDQPIRTMSRVTHSLLGNINYQKSKLVREENFIFIHSELKSINALAFDYDPLQGPMIYPFVTDLKDLKEKLIARKVYVASYWSDVLSRVEENTIEASFTKFLIAIPIDQRYSLSDMKNILNIII